MNEENNIKIDPLEYLNEKTEIQYTIKNNQSKALVEANKAMIMTYYEIGTLINNRKQFGDKYIERLADDLKEYGKGYTFENLKYKARFASIFTKDEMEQHSIAIVPWDFILTIMINCESHDEILWYIVQTIKNGWSKAMLMQNIVLNRSNV